MALPKVSHPILTLLIPSNKKEIKVRPMLSKEEKLLLMAKEANTDEDILAAIKQVVNNCILDKGVDIDKLAIFDLEFLFLRLRAFSISNTAEVSYKDHEDYQFKVKEMGQSGFPPDRIEEQANKYSVYDFQIDLNKIEVEYPKDIDRMIPIDDKTTLRMRYAPASMFTDQEFLKSEPNEQEGIYVRRCLDAIIQDGVETKIANETKEEVEEFIANLPIPVYNKIKEFIVNPPTVHYEIKYTNKQGNEQKIVLQSLADFFTFR